MVHSQLPATEEVMAEYEFDMEDFAELEIGKVSDDTKGPFPCSIEATGFSSPSVCDS